MTAHAMQDPGRRQVGLALALAAVPSSVVLPGQLAAVVNEEAGHAGEFILLDRHDLDGQFFVGQVSPGQLKTLSQICLIQIDDGITGPGALGGLQIIERLRSSSSCAARGAS